MLSLDVIQTASSLIKHKLNSLRTSRWNIPRSTSSSNYFKEKSKLLLLPVKSILLYLQLYFWSNKRRIKFVLNSWSNSIIRNVLKLKFYPQFYSSSINIKTGLEFSKQILKCYRESISHYYWLFDDKILWNVNRFHLTSIYFGKNSLFYKNIHVYCSFPDVEYCSMWFESICVVFRGNNSDVFLFVQDRIEKSRVFFKDLFALRTLTRAHLTSLLRNK